MTFFSEFSIITDETKSYYSALLNVNILRLGVNFMTLAYRTGHSCEFGRQFFPRRTSSHKTSEKVNNFFHEEG
ncbi:hypothetical protein TNCV_1473581 [Trichonephila clavipes]|nr:hypothetical protein TNCV_1473581 [Trichonephila clavipes]